MYYTYALYSLKSKRIYIGYTEDLRQRVQEHNQGVGGGFTSKNRPLRLIFYEAFLAEDDAKKQEKFYKSGYGREVLKDKLKESLKKVDS